VTDKLQVVVDMLREHGFDAEAKWIEQREHVAFYLTTLPADRNGECPDGCGGYHSVAHIASCKVAAAWRALGDPRGAEDIEVAHEEALRDEAWRNNPNYGAPMTVNEYLRSIYSPELVTSDIYPAPLLSLIPRKK